MKLGQIIRALHRSRIRREKVQLLCTVDEPLHASATVDLIKAGYVNVIGALRGLEKMKDDVFATRLYHQLFDDCLASYSIFSDLYQHIDNLLVQVFNNVKRLHPIASLIQITQ